jgi:plastocyanin
MMGSMGMAGAMASTTDATASCPLMGTMPMMPMMGMMPMMPMHGMMAPRMGRQADMARRGELRTTVYVYDGFFLPSEITIPVGTTVTWVNRSTSPQSVASPGIWDSGTIPPGGRYAAVFAVEGTFPYMGKEGMQGRITVAAAPSAMAGQMGATAPTGAPAPQATQPAAGTMTASATLQPQRDSGVTGEATLTQSGNTTTVTVRLRAPSGGTAHAGHIHGGSCNGPILFPLETIQLDASGQGSATSTVNAPLDPNTWWIQYHQSASPPGPGVTCGQVMASR